MSEVVLVEEQEAMRKLMAAVDESGRGARNAIGPFIPSRLDLDNYSRAHSACGSFGELWEEKMGRRKEDRFRWANDQKEYDVRNLI